MVLPVFADLLLPLQSDCLLVGSCQDLFNDADTQDLVPKIGFKEAKRTFFPVPFEFPPTAHIFLTLSTNTGPSIHLIVISLNLTPLYQAIYPSNPHHATNKFMGRQKHDQERSQSPN